MHRPSYMQKLISGMGSDQVKVVTGIRRCGKSFLVFNLFEDYPVKLGGLKADIIEMAFYRPRRHVRCRHVREGGRFSWSPIALVMESSHYALINVKYSNITSLFMCNNTKIRM